MDSDGAEVRNTPKKRGEKNKKVRREVPGRTDRDGAEVAKRKFQKKKGEKGEKIRPRKWGERWTATELRQPKEKRKKKRKSDPGSGERGGRRRS